MKHSKKVSQLSYIEQIQRQEDLRCLRLLTKAAGIPKMEVSIHPCSFGQVLIGSDQDRLTAVELGHDVDECYRNFINRWSKVNKEVLVRTNHQIVDSVLQSIETGAIDPSLKVYLAGAGTWFQNKVWEAIREIQPGQTMSYKDIALRIGRKDSFRAVGTSCGLNPIAVIVPCHRVVRSDGGEGGYRWGLEVKRKLLQREQT
jgi:AraC family transcriptional regulator, regulatory protein of adaptative response / methylated-DNA-[protein]-cysteine methyltransferase